MCSTTGVCTCRVHRWTCRWVDIQISMIIILHATRQRNRTIQSRARSSQRSMYHRFVGPTRRPITPALVFAAGGKLLTRLPPRELVEQLGSPNSTEPTKEKSKDKTVNNQKINIRSSIKDALIQVCLHAECIARPAPG